MTVLAYQMAVTVHDGGTIFMRLSGKWFARGKRKASFTTISLICYYILNLRTSTISLATYVQLKI